MAPSPVSPSMAGPVEPRVFHDPLTADNTREQLIVEAWAQGFNVGALVLITLVVLCNYRKNVLLHKLIVLELVLAVWHGFFIFFSDPAYGWILSSTATPLYVSYNLHNVVAWIKIKPFLPKWGGLFFIITLALVQPYWILETWANFAYFNDLAKGNKIFETTRYLEPLFRDPWWIFTTIKLVLVINKNYEYTVLGLIHTSPRFGVMLLCMFASIVFIVTDIVVTALVSVQSGINPFWRLALVFKCASDAIFLDDFKSVLDRIAESALKYVANLPYGSIGDGKPSHVSGRRRGSSVGFRRPSAAPNRFNGGNQPRHVVHISADGGPNSGSAIGTTTEPHFKYSRDNWPSSAFSPRNESGYSSDQQRAIRADTTITISENDELNEQKSSQSTHHERSDSQERMLPAGMGTSTTRVPDYGWGEPGRNTPGRTNDPEAGIPMMPMRARTKQQ